MIIIIGKKDWVLKQIREATKKHSTLFEWYQSLKVEQQTNPQPMLIQKRMDLL